MKLIGLMLVRNEEWVIEASLRAALQWCDHVYLLFHACLDQTVPRVCKIQAELGRVTHETVFDAGKWDEMYLRDHTLRQGRKLGGTHFAIIDADEILTANFLTAIRGAFADLKPRQQLMVPMVPVWEGLDKYRSDRCAWTYRNDLTLGFCDDLALSWRPREDGYHHHSRPPSGIEGEPLRPTKWGNGGVMHLQFANKRRLLAKHILYRMVDHLRWPGRRTPEQLNRIYSEALEPARELTTVPAEWWGAYRKDLIDLDGVPWQETEIRRLLAEHGRAAFDGLDLRGFDAAR